MKTKAKAKAKVNVALVRGVDGAGDVVWFTGRAGDGWISRDRAEAFAGFNFEGAERKARVLNQYTWAHNVWFVAVIGAQS